MRKHRRTMREVIQTFRYPILVVGIIAAGLIFVAPAVIASTDSGVQACQDIVARSKGDAPKPTTREAFEDSNYADLIVAGTNFVDAVTEGKTRVSDDSGLQTDFGVVSKVHATYASLQIACGAHGVKLPNLKS